ncbi:hypothetical protein SAMN05216516_105209 [Izhakiella capsodis]|uniref:Uncharacterized protein n=1 Tax=Izhakiella capsodis TaxID=1367852 RepID=A0A1I4Y4N7_9GAMM|nr:hypothetical protein [Izhakiella capsodis]SFN32977.1 hypothetical protein SAMN05216516_105209 [Izhakiella capsodis]
MGQYIQLVAVYAAGRLRQGYGSAAKKALLRTSLHLNEGVNTFIPSYCTRRSFSVRKPVMVATTEGLRDVA